MASNVALWVANGPNVLEFIPSQAGGSDLAPEITLCSSPGFTLTQGVQFDANGDLWVLDGGDESGRGAALDEFTPAQLEAHATNPCPAPKTVTFPGIKFPQQGVFDTQGDFWVADNKANEVVEFTPSQLAAGGYITPKLTLMSTMSTRFNGPLGIAFSPTTGDLWVANNGTTSTAGTSIAGTSIEGFAAASLVGAGMKTIAPRAVLNDSHGSIQAPWALVFDSAGNLWSSNSNSPSTIVEFASAELEGAGVASFPVPNITIAPAIGGNAPNGLAFDNLGGLWEVSSAAPLGIALFAAWQLAASGSAVPRFFLVVPATTLTTPTAGPAGDVFGPDVQ
jgi:sugar lactone lactonase YvrE